MKPFIEGESYTESQILERLNSNDRTLISEFKDDNNRPFFKRFTEGGLLYPDTVGYIRLNKLASGKIIYFLPKVYSNIIIPEDITKHGNDTEWLRKLNVYFHKGLEQFRKFRNEESSIPERLESLELNSSIADKEYSYYEIVRRFEQFFIKNKNTILFKHIEHVSSTAKKAKWEKTIRKSTPFINSSGQPIYTEIYNKKKIINNEEELISIFFSILNHFNNEGFLNLKIDKSYPLIKGSAFKSLCKEKGLIKLRKIKHRYFSDIMKEMYRLNYIFLSDSMEGKSRKIVKEYMVVNKYNIVYEAMLDKLLSGNNESRVVSRIGNMNDIFKLNDLKDTNDGMFLDHIYMDRSLIDKNGYICYIADSKYYGYDKKKAASDASFKKMHGVSKFKQFSYSKSVIQNNINLLNQNNHNESLFYRDEITEGYNITPNFFISGYVTQDIVNEYGLSVLEFSNENNPDKSYENIFQWKFRLFDRDTLYALHFKINFQYLLKTYISRSNDYLNDEGEKLKITFRESFETFIKKSTGYEFYKLKFLTDSDCEDFVLPNFKALLGKAISFPITGEGRILIIALHKDDKDFRTEVSKILRTPDDYKCEFNFDNINVKQFQD